MSKMEIYQIQVMQLLGELDGGHRTHRATKDGAALTQQFEEVVENYRNSEQSQSEN